MWSSFWVIAKITSANLCKSIHDIINYSTSICPFISEVWKGKEKITKNWISQEREELFRWNKRYFSGFKGLSFGEKIKIWYKKSDTRFKWCFQSKMNFLSVPKIPAQVVGWFKNKVSFYPQIVETIYYCKWKQ